MPSPSLMLDPQTLTKKKSFLPELLFISYLDTVTNQVTRSWPKQSGQGSHALLRSLPQLKPLHHSSCGQPCSRSPPSGLHLMTDWSRIWRGEEAQYSRSSSQFVVETFIPDDSSLRPRRTNSPILSSGPCLEPRSLVWQLSEESMHPVGTGTL